MLSTLVLWLQEVWRTNIFGGAGTALLTPFISLGLCVIALRRPIHFEVDSHNHWGIVLQYVMGVVAIGILLEPGKGSAWMLLLAVCWPFWLLSWIAVSFGYQKSRQLVFPILFLWFCLPFEPYLYETLDTPLQEMTTDVAVWLLGLAGYEVQYWNAHSFYSEDFWIIVDETCSGMNMIVTLTMYALIFGWVTRHRLSSRLVLLGSVLPFALLSNGLRVAAIYLLGLYGGEALAKGFWHEGSGVLAFLPTLFGIYAIGEGLRAFHRRRANSGNDNNSSKLPIG